MGTDNATYRLIDTIQRKWEQQVQDFEKAVEPIEHEPMLITGFVEQNENKYRLDN